MSIIFENKVKLCSRNHRNKFIYFAVQTNEVLTAAKEIKQKGATGAYSRQFETMVKKIDEVKQILDETELSANQLGDLQGRANQLRYRICCLMNFLIF